MKPETQNSIRHFHHTVFDVIRHFSARSFDFRQLWISLYSAGNQCLLVITAASIFIGAMMIIQITPYVRNIGVYDLVPWGVGFSLFREIGPVLIAMIFSAKAGTYTTSELATMAVTEQIDSLHSLAIHPHSFFIVPRVIAFLIMLVILTIIGNLIALSTAAILATQMMEIPFTVFYQLFCDTITFNDLLLGIIKAAIIGPMMALICCHFGITTTDGTQGVGKSVKQAVVWNVVLIVVFDFLITDTLKLS